MKINNSKMLHYKFFPPKYNIMSHKVIRTLYVPARLLT